MTRAHTYEADGRREIIYVHKLHGGRNNYRYVSPTVVTRYRFHQKNLCEEGSVKTKQEGKFGVALQKITGIDRSEIEISGIVNNQNQSSNKSSEQCHNKNELFAIVKL